MSEINVAVLLSALALGFFGSAHCIAMCGGICSALSFALPPGRPGLRLLILIGYNLGRIGSYVLIALIFALLSQLLAKALGPDSLRLYLGGLRFIAGVLLIAMGLYLADWWRGLRYLEQGGQKLWRFFAPLAQKLTPVRRFSTAILYGAVWGWLPCGLVYSALALAVTQHALPAAGLTMFAFGLGTLPALLVTGLLAEQLQKLLANANLKRLFALLLIVFGVWTILYSGGHQNHAQHTATDSGEVMESEHHHH
ncbi:sulfite exporter TauE/SafE family protein [Halioxenophilus sp. WMMB6]|uniref:sulfite exporter TauE/SafE family protein n=1 Tax=Halioxenophilus sp. WMMB6 TaxID=3073815 RepID=UPI00295F0984|nr:sulfite exporter TauE/SafE family protein [Halioxenophilus sp. WMMB6]